MNMSEAGAASRRFGCPSCGGGLRYDILEGKMKCDRCGSLTAVESLPEEQEGDGTLEVTEYHCPQCGAAVYSTDTEATSFCSFCGSDVVLTGKLARTRRPAWIVPFQVTREQCEEAYRKHLKTHLLAPKALKAAETLSHFRPVYVPFWSYQVESEGPAFLEGKKSYTKGDYHYDETSNLYMDAEIRQKGILYDASTAFEDETAAMLHHTAREQVKFHPAYLSGLYAQAADVPPETYQEEAAASAVRLFMEQVKEKTAMDSVEMKGNIRDNFGLPNARYAEELVMMPVWLLAHRTGDRVVYTAVNGRSGEVVCDVPVSNGRAAGMGLALAAVIFVLLQQFLTLKPDLMLTFCAVLALLIQYLFSGAQKRLFNRRTRAGEPDFEGERKYVGAAASRLKEKDGKLALKGGFLSGAGGFVKSLPAIAGAALCIAVFAAPEFLFDLGSASSRRIIEAGVLLVSAVIMIIHTIRRIRAEDGGPRWPRLISCLACAAGLAAFLMSQAEDLIYYACAAALLLASLAELFIINRSHNEYASRPVPFFGEKEGAA